MFRCCSHVLKLREISSLFRSCRSIICAVMAAVDRADYMDNIKVAEVEQTIQKEKECVLRHL